LVRRSFLAVCRLLLWRSLVVAQPTEWLQPRSAQKKRTLTDLDKYRRHSYEHEVTEKLYIQGMNHVLILNILLFRHYYAYIKRYLAWYITTIALVHRWPFQPVSLRPQFFQIRGLVPQFQQRMKTRVYPSMRQLSRR
jgi:hypothetical protein